LFWQKPPSTSSPVVLKKAMAREIAMSNSVMAGPRKKYFQATTAIATKVTENNATTGLIPMEFDFVNDANCQSNTATASRKMVTKRPYPKKKSQ